MINPHVSRESVENTDSISVTGRLRLLTESWKTKSFFLGVYVTGKESTTHSRVDSVTESPQQFDLAPAPAVCHTQPHEMGAYGVYSWGGCSCLPKAIFYQFPPIAKTISLCSFEGEAITHNGFRVIMGRGQCWNPKRIDLHIGGGLSYEVC